ncbi:ATP-grasp domain-containing protein [Streptomyces sp. NBC_01142]|uniref:ATP-grasp domain-containing protein n=1 Tax=Streptomyces sp. NBC_01142 TaxID=2975865 RepID=UPI0022562E36|nr:ATP-grasp domain-containing protein [Streptomyces sp. NBC_01142]MCX4826706.1 ATP-grasp domain-containing protein [Streptomyces sp. NBC_01142]
MSDHNQPVLLVLGAGDRAYRAFLLQEFAARHDLVLLDNQSPAWTRPYVTDAVNVDLHDHHAVSRAVTEIALRQPIAGVTTYLEHHVELVAQLAKELGLPGAAPEAVAACRDKARTRQLLAEYGVPSARSVLVDSAEEAAAAADAIGYPVVVKPRGLGGSAGVRRADYREHVIAYYQEAATATLIGLEESAVAGVLVEEYLRGPEISVECVVHGRGDVHIAAITRKRLGSEPTFLETGHLVDATDPLLEDPSLHHVVTAAIKAVGIASGVLHVEVRLTRQGPHIIEINARLGGDLIPRLVHLATGVSLPQAQAALATGDTPELTASVRQSAAVEFHYPPATGPVQTAHADALSADWLERLVWTHQQGDFVNAGPHSTINDRVVHAVVCGPTPDACRTRLDQVLQNLTVHIAVPVRTTACVR